MTSGIVASAKSAIRRTEPASMPQATTATNTTAGPVQPRTPKATMAPAAAKVSFVTGFRAR